MQLETFSKCKPFRARVDTIRRLTLYPLGSLLTRFCVSGVPHGSLLFCPGTLYLNLPHWATSKQNGRDIGRCTNVHVIHGWARVRSLIGRFSRVDV